MVVSSRHALMPRSRAVGCDGGHRYWNLKHGFTLSQHAYSWGYRYHVVAWAYRRTRTNTSYTNFSLEISPTQVKGFVPRNWLPRDAWSYLILVRKKDDFRIWFTGSNVWLAVILFIRQCGELLRSLSDQTNGNHRVVKDCVMYGFSLCNESNILKEN